MKLNIMSLEALNATDYVIDEDINSIGPTTDPWGTPLTTSFHLNTDPLIYLWTQTAAIIG